MIKTLGLCLATLVIIVWSVAQYDQLAMFSDFFSPTFVFLGGTIATSSLNKELDNLATRRLEAFRWGSALVAVLGVLIGAITILANLDEPKKLGPAVALALLTLFWATVFNYLCKFIIENKKLNERPSP